MNLKTEKDTSAIILEFCHDFSTAPPIILLLYWLFKLLFKQISSCSLMPHPFSITIIQHKCISHKRLNAFAREAFQNYFAIVLLLKFFQNFTVKRGTQVLIHSKILHIFSYDFVTTFVIFEQISAICLHTYLKGIFHQITSYGHTKISHEECSKSGKNLKIKLKLCGSLLYLHKWMKTSSKMNQNSSLLEVIATYRKDLCISISRLFKFGA